MDGLEEPPAGLEPTEMPSVDAGTLSDVFGSQESVQDLSTDLTLTDGERLALGAALSALAVAAEESDLLGAADNEFASVLQTYLSEQGHDPQSALETRPGTDGRETAGLEYVSMDSHDWHYLKAAWPELRERLGHPHRDPRPPLVDTPAALPSTARMAVFGDWGTGCYGAQAVGRTIRDDADGYDAVVHLGDTYYTGSQKEIETRFLPYWPPAKPGGVRRACSSNHEMYSGGKPFYELVLPACEQDSTVFTLANDEWLFVGLDTGYRSGRIDDDQQKWLEGVLDDLAGRRLVLFTHHHGWSHHKDRGDGLIGDLGPAFELGVTAWYWGHEHLFAWYDPCPIGKSPAVAGRCVGHGGYPYFRNDYGDAEHKDLGDDMFLWSVPATTDAPRADELDGPNEYVGDRAQRYGPNGFLRLELDGAHLSEVLCSPSGVVLERRQVA